MVMRNSPSVPSAVMRKFMLAAAATVTETLNIAAVPGKMGPELTKLACITNISSTGTGIFLEVPPLNNITYMDNLETL